MERQLPVPSFTTLQHEPLSKNIQEGQTQDARRRSSTLLPRLVIGIFLLTAICLPYLYQPLITTVYQYLCHSTFYRFSGFETILTVSCYTIMEPLYTYKFGHNHHLRIDIRSRAQDSRKPGPRMPKMRRPRHRIGEIITYVAPLLFLDFVLIKKFADVSINDIRRSGNYAPLESSMAVMPPLQAYRSTQNDAAVSVSPSFLLPTMHNFSLSSPIQLERALPLLPPTSRRVLLELMGAFFIYDSVFFVLHMAFHKVKPLARIHNPHHTHAEIYPQVTNRLSISERVSLIMLANFALNIIGSHVLTRTCFVPLFVYLLIEVHCGMDLDWGYSKLLPEGWGAGPKIHAEHHRTGTGAYAPFFGWWDAAFAYFESTWKISVSEQSCLNVKVTRRH